MHLILSDRPLAISPSDPETTVILDLSRLNIAHCVGCFGCWTKTPGKCVIRDDGVTVYPLIAACDKILYVSRIRYGGYDTTLKTMLERAIPIQQAFIRLHQGETHHIQRAVAPKQAVIIGYGPVSAQEEDLFRQLADRNARNMNFLRHRVLVVPERAVEETVRNEVQAWEAC